MALNNLYDVYPSEHRTNDWLEVITSNLINVTCIISCYKKTVKKELFYHLADISSRADYRIYLKISKNNGKYPRFKRIEGYVRLVLRLIFFNLTFLLMQNNLFSTS